MNCNPTAIKLKALTKIYNTRDGAALKAIDDLSLTITQGQVFGILGASGAGKTTLVKLLGGLINPTAGHICLNGYRLAPTHPLTIDQVGLVLAEAWPEEKRHYWTTSLRQKLLSKKRTGYLGLEGPYNIRRLIDLACVLMADPPLVILDEPLAGLEPQLAQVVKIWLAQLVSQPGKTIVLATECPDLVEELCDEVAVLNHGRLMIQQPVARLLQCPQAATYQITIQGHLPGHWSSWFDNLTMTHTEQGETVLSGVIVDQAALHGILGRVRDLALPLLSVLRTKPSLANVMQSLKQAEDYRGQVDMNS